LCEESFLILSIFHELSDVYEKLKDLLYVKLCKSVELIIILLYIKKFLNAFELQGKLPFHKCYAVIQFVHPGDFVCCIDAKVCDCCSIMDEFIPQLKMKLLNSWNFPAHSSRRFCPQKWNLYSSASSQIIAKTFTAKSKIKVCSPLLREEPLLAKKLDANFALSLLAACSIIRSWRQLSISFLHTKKEEDTLQRLIYT